jgi:transmembrane sensor
MRRTMNVREVSDLIEKYRAGRCSPGEKELLERYLESFQKESGEWKEGEMGDQRIIGAKIYSEIIAQIQGEKIHPFKRVVFSPVWLGRAASILFLFIISFGLLYLSGTFTPKPVSPTWIEKVTASGEKLSITLTDGSKVILNADSKLKYPKHFDNNRREIYLEGEAYFEVFHNPEQPFIVHAEKLTTTVLGTKFNISAYTEKKNIAVSLLEGSVKVVDNEQQKNDEAIFLNPKEQLLFNKAKNRSLIQKFDPVEIIGWRDNIYKFENKPLEEVLSQLERAFGVTFKLSDQSVLTQKITIKFENNSLQTVVNVVKSLTGLKSKVVWSEEGKREILLF